MKLSESEYETGARFHQIAVIDDCSVLSHHREVTNTEGFARFYEQILKRGQTKHVCIGCNRKLEEDYMNDFVTHVRADVAVTDPTRR